MSTYNDKKAYGDLLTPSVKWFELTFIEYIIQTKAKYAFFSSSHGTLTKIKHILVHSQSPLMGGCFWLINRDLTHGIQALAHSQAHEALVGSLDHLVSCKPYWPPQPGSGPHHTNSWLCLLAGSVNNAFLKGDLCRCGETPDRLKYARAELRPCWGRLRTAPYDFHLLFLMVQEEGHPNHPEN